MESNTTETLRSNVPVKENRLLELDGLRGIACSSVVLFHYSKYLHKNYNLSWQFSYGVTGVDLFFIISGFVIYMTLTKTNKVSEFVISRVARLFPVYWFAVTLTSVLCLIFKFNLNTVTPGNYLGNLTMMPLYAGVPNIDNSYWTLLAELQFYVLIAFFYYAIKSISVFNKSLMLLALMIVINAVSIYTHHGQKIMLYTQLLSFWNLFFTGMIFYKIKNEDHKLIYSLVIAVNLLIVFFTHDQAGFSRFYLTPAEHLLCDVFFACLFFLAVKKMLPFLSNKVLVFLGAISYSTYLIHQTIGYIMMDQLQRVISSSIICLIIAVTAITFFAFLVNKYIEKPLMWKFKSFLTGAMQKTVSYKANS